MHNAAYVGAAIGISAAITFALRAIPFAIVAPLRACRLVGVLGSRMPAGVMLILVIYLLRGVPQAPPSRAVAELTALATTVGLHLWRRNVLLSLVAGTALNVALIALLR